MRIFATALRKLIRDESGQSLVVVVSSMTVLLGVAAFGIDAATWMAKHHQAQVVADSAALAAAHCLANPGQSGSIVLNGTQTTVPACTSGTDTTDADQVAIEYAAANGLTITASNVNVNTTSDTVSVNAPATSGGRLLSDCRDQLRRAQSGGRQGAAGQPARQARAPAPAAPSATRCTPATPPVRAPTARARARAPCPDSRTATPVAVPHRP